MQSPCHLPPTPLSTKETWPLSVNKTASDAIPPERAGRRCACPDWAEHGRGSIVKETVSSRRKTAREMRLITVSIKGDAARQPGLAEQGRSPLRRTAGTQRPLARGEN